MSVTYSEHPDDRYFEVVIDGRVGKDDIDRILPCVRTFMAAHSSVSVLEVVRSLGFVNVPAALPYAGFGLGAITKVKRAALVTDLILLRQMALMATLISPIETKVFGLDEEDAARAWLADVSES